MAQACRCTVPEHKHPNNRCPNPATTPDGFCQECHDKAIEAQEVTRD